VLLEPDRPTVARELLGEANRLAQLIDGDTLAITVSAENVDELASWGADRVVSLIGSDRAARDIAQGVADISQVSSLWSIVAPSTSWGREVSARVAVLLSTGLTGDAIELDIESAEATPRLVAWKGTLGGHFLVAIRCTTLPQMATVRPGVLPLRPPRQATQVEVSEHKLSSISSVVTHSIERNDDVEELERASRVVAVGAGVSPDAYDAIHAFAAAIDATLAATRKVTDRGWMPHARQVGITGRTIRPDLYVAIGLSGKFNHIVGAQSSGTVLAINDDPNAPIFASCDVGIVGDWAEVLPLLQVGLGAALKEAR
jgi:electron transfer flavoprotein alpha subunit